MWPKLRFQLKGRVMNAQFPDLPNRVAIAHRAADAAAKVTLQWFHAPLIADNKRQDGFDPVTIADRDAETAIRALLAEEAPDDAILGEEFGASSGRSGWRWVLDPIDGTRAFITGIPLWTTLIGLEKDGEPVLGLIDQPYLRERYVGTPEGAQLLRGAEAPECLHIRHTEKLTTAVLMCTTPHMFNPAEAAAFQQVSDAARLTRFGADAYAYAQLAAGRVDLVIEAGLQLFDIAALIPVVRGAGGVFTDWRGGQNFAAGQVIAASSAGIAAEAQVALHRSAR
jgi:histidinol phosphatase-like enzyme (inositol monophosphatase family)